MHLFKRVGKFRLLTLMAAIAAGILAVSLSFGSSHREAPGTMLDPSADDTDVYAFTADDAPGALTVVANWIPFEDGAGGPNFYRFDDRADYYINVDNTGDGKYDVRYKFEFKTNYRNKNSFLYALPGVTSLSDRKLQVLQGCRGFELPARIVNGYGCIALGESRRSENPQQAGSDMRISLGAEDGTRPRSEL